MPEYRATTLQELTEAEVPPEAGLSWDLPAPWGKGKVRARVGRELLSSTTGGETLARFADRRAAVTRRRCGKGEVIHAGFWVGLAYSAQVRRKDYDMRADFDPALRAMVAATALGRDAYRPIVPSDPLVEAVLLEKDGKRSVALMNWGYRSTPGGVPGHEAVLQAAKTLTIAIPGLRDAHSICSLRHGPLPIQGTGAERSVPLPELMAIDLLVVE